MSFTCLPHSIGQQYSTLQTRLLLSWSCDWWSPVASCCLPVSQMSTVHQISGSRNCKIQLCLTAFYGCDKPEVIWEEWVSFSFQVPVWNQGNQGRDSRLEVTALTMEKCCTLAAPRLTLGYFLFCRPNQATEGWHCPWLPGRSYLNL